MTYSQIKRAAFAMLLMPSLCWANTAQPRDYSKKSMKDRVQWDVQIESGMFGSESGSSIPQDAAKIAADPDDIEESQFQTKVKMKLKFQITKNLSATIGARSVNEKTNNDDSNDPANDPHADRDARFADAKFDDMEFLLDQFYVTWTSDVEGSDGSYIAVSAGVMSLSDAMEAGFFGVDPDLLLQGISAEYKNNGGDIVKAISIQTGHVPTTNKLDHFFERSWRNNDGESDHNYTSISVEGEFNNGNFQYRITGTQYNDLNTVRLQASYNIGNLIGDRMRGMGEILSTVYVDYLHSLTEEKYTVQENGQDVEKEADSTRMWQVGITGSLNLIREKGLKWNLFYRGFGKHVDELSGSNYVNDLLEDRHFNPANYLDEDGDMNGAIGIMAELEIMCGVVAVAEWVNSEKRTYYAGVEVRLGDLLSKKCQQ